MLNTSPPARYAVVMDGHTADETLAGYALAGLFTRDRAIELVEEMGTGWHAEHLAAQVSLQNEITVQVPTCGCLYPHEYTRPEFRRNCREV